jgi:aminopeptidase N
MLQLCGLIIFSFTSLLAQAPLGDLDWFFRQWIYQAGYPEYGQASWTNTQGPNFALNS